MREEEEGREKKIVMPKDEKEEVGKKTHRFLYVCFGFVLLDDGIPNEMCAYCIRN